MLSDREITFVRERLDDDIHGLLLSKHRFSGIDIPLCVRQIEGLRKLRDKVPEWFACRQIYIPSLQAVEQASSAQTAAYKTRFAVGDEPVVDMTGGLGVDAYFFAKEREHVIYAEKEDTLCRAAEYNFQVLGIGGRISVLNRDAGRLWEGSNIPYASLVYADPSRRDEKGRRLYEIGSCSPDVTRLRESVLDRAGAFLVKVSPLADISRTLSLLPGSVEVHVVSSGNECKELLFLIKRNEADADDPLIVCSDGFSFRRGEEAGAADVLRREGLPGVLREGSFLYEPGTSLLKAGAFALPVFRYGVEKIHRNSHLYTSDRAVPHFPGRKFVIREVVPFTSGNMKKLNTRFPKANMTVRNFPLSVDQWRKKTGIIEGGTIYLFGTTAYIAGKETRVIIYTTKSEENI
ncbi:MAG TPA: SAM-dependent methyltransferase [Bacteroidales bacterium]|nr:SAM-dependent methyltransferase [Bacteroidales bacterium]HQB56458.1 SAM-dependent methyltransferase [Bacteroidales bacterium]